MSNNARETIRTSNLTKQAQPTTNVSIEDLKTILRCSLTVKLGHTSGKKYINWVKSAVTGQVQVWKEWSSADPNRAAC